MWTIMRKYLQFAGSYQASLQKGLVYSFINSLFEALQVGALIVVLQAVVFNTVSWFTVGVSFGIMLLSVLGSIVFGHFASVNKVEAGYMMCGEKRTEIGDRMRYMPMGFFNENSLGTIVDALTNKLEELQEVGSRIIIMTFPAMIYSLIIGLMLLIFDWRIGLIVFAGMALFFVVLAFMQRMAATLSPDRVAAQSAIVVAILEYIQGMAVVRAFNTAGNAERAINDAISECEKQNVRFEFKFIRYSVLQSLVLKAACVVMCVVSILLFVRGSMEAFVCLAMVIASFIVYNKLEAAGQFSSLLRQIDLCIDKVREILDAPVMSEPKVSTRPTSFDISAKGIGFSYEKRKVIDGVSFSIPEKTTCAIVGPSGSGKTTVCNLITRFWDVDEGSISLGGKNIKDYSLDDLLACFSFVFQNVYLFNDTIESNIKFGKPNATDAEMIAAAKAACCHDFILSLPDGYQTMIGEGGATISGGEKQRISIARAMLKDAPIVILDEATANVDPENERDLQVAIEGLTKNKTVIMIAHRLKTVRHADQILVMDEGCIVARGKHDELMSREGIYSDFVKGREQAISWKMRQTV